jgi:hypothetical protein
MKMEYTAMIRRGWPNEGALDRAEPIKAGATLVNGDWVAKQADGTVDKSAAAASNAVGLVVSGNGDSPNFTVNGIATGNSVVNSKKAVVLWSGFIVQTSNYAAGAYVPGSMVTVKAGQIALGTPGTDPEVGRVLDVVAAGPNDTASLVILVK